MQGVVLEHHNYFCVKYEDVFQVERSQLMRLDALTGTLRVLLVGRAVTAASAALWATSGLSSHGHVQQGRQVQESQ